MISFLRRHRYTLTLACLSIAHASRAQVDTTFSRTVVGYKDYLGLVARNNIGYAVEKFSVGFAEAQIEIAKVFPNPQLYYGYIDNGQNRMKLGFGYAVNASGVIELGGKRKARIDLASRSAELTRSLLENYFRNLRADATLEYLAALKSKYIVDVMINSYKSITRVADLDSIRFQRGAITEIDAHQSRVESDHLLNTVYETESEWKMALADLSLIVGKIRTDTLFYPKGDFIPFERQFTLGDLIATALNNRADLVAALQNTKVAESARRLAMANRMVDLGIIVGSNNISAAYNNVAPGVSFNSVYGGITFPLKFSNNYKGDVKIADYTVEQSQLQYRQAELQVETEVVRAFFNYVGKERQVKLFQSGLLDEAHKVLEGKIYSYNRGKSLLLEVLIAQRTYNEIQLNYYETLFNRAAALVELERSVGIWDINF